MTYFNPFDPAAETMTPSFSSQSQSDDSEREDIAMAAQISTLSKQVRTYSHLSVCVYNLHLLHYIPVLWASNFTGEGYPVMHIIPACHVEFALGTSCS